MNIRDQIVSKVKTFPSLPVLTNRLLQLISRSDYNVNEVAQVIMYDPAMTANVLKAANSAYMGCAKTITSLSEATLRLGTKWIVQMAVSAVVYSNINRPAEGYDMSGNDLWRHSAAVGLVSETLAKFVKLRDQGLVFTAGLVHDIGKIAVGQVAKESFEDVIKLAVEQEIPFERAEDQVLGINHAEAGAIILEHWNFPTDIVEAVRWHHDPDEGEVKSPVIDVVHVADALCIMQGVVIGRDDLMYSPSQQAMERLKLTSSILEEVSSHLLDQLEEIEKLFEIEDPTEQVREVNSNVT